MKIHHKITDTLIMKDCRHGLVLYRSNDMYLGRSIHEYGEFSVGEQEIFSRYIEPGAIAVDVGANIGIHTLEMSRLARAVISIEMERQLYQMLCANIALNNRNNVVPYNAAAGATKGILMVPGIDFSVDGNFGCLSGEGHENGDPVSMIAIDSLSMSGCGFMKIDVEGMEEQVIEGARYTIRKYKPVLYVENDRKEKSPALISHLLRMGYRLYWHLPMLFNKRNYAGNMNNVFEGLASLNMICLPDDRECDGIPIKGPNDWWETVNHTVQENV